MDTANQPIGLQDDISAEALGVLEDAADGFVACDSAFRILFLNSVAERLCGKSKPEILGTTPWESSSDFGGAELELDSRRVMAERVPATLESYNHRVALWLEVRVSPAAWGGISIWFRDITERRRAEEKLRIAHAELAAIHAHAPMVFLLADEDLCVRKVNE